MGTAAMKTAEQKVKEFQQTEEAKAWEERMRGNVSALGKLGTLFSLIHSIQVMICVLERCLRCHPRLHPY